jgi:hypothetical protein
MKRIIFTFSLLLALPATLPAAEVINLKVGQSGDKGFATYDLAGRIGEREAEITVTLTIQGEKYTADKLTLTGDFGKKVKTGVGKRIVWDILSDISTGFDGEVTWNVDSVGGNAPAAVKEPTKPVVPPVPAPLPAAKDSPFEFGELVARDRSTGLLWLRTVSKDGNGMDFDKARSVAIKLATEKLGGCSDWKLPQTEDLSRIISYAFAAGYKGKRSKGYPADYFNAIGFKGVANDYYWAAYNARPGIAYLERVAVDMEDGI